MEPHDNVLLNEQPEPLLKTDAMEPPASRMEEAVARAPTRRKGRASGKTEMEAEVGPTSNDGAPVLRQSEIYRVEVTVEGTTDLLFHRWSSEDVSIKAKAAKGSRAKTTENPSNYVYRDPEGYICLPGEYMRQAIIGAAKFSADPRSKRKSAQDLAKAAFHVEPKLAILIPGANSPHASKRGAQKWDYDHRARVRIQHSSSVERIRPAFYPGWRATFLITVVLPEYFASTLLHELIANAGRFVGVGDYRPTYGRFQVVRFDVLDP